MPQCRPLARNPDGAVTPPSIGDVTGTGRRSPPSTEFDDVHVRELEYDAYWPHLLHSVTRRSVRDLRHPGVGTIGNRRRKNVGSWANAHAERSVAPGTRGRSSTIRTNAECRASRPTTSESTSALRRQRGELRAPTIRAPGEEVSGQRRTEARAAISSSVRGRMRLLRDGPHHACTRRNSRDRTNGYWSSAFTHAGRTRASVRTVSTTHSSSRYASLF